VASTIARSAASRSRCWLMGCRPTSSIPWMSTAPPQDERDQAAYQSVVARGIAIAATHPRRRGRYDRDVERARRRSDRRQRAGRARLERGRNLLCQPAGAERRSQREGGVAILQFRGAGEAPGDFAMLLPYGPANPGARSLMTQARLRQTPAWPENEKI